MSLAQLRLKAFDVTALTTCVVGIQELAKVHGVDKPSVVPLPRKCSRFTVLRSPHVYKKAREQFQLVTHSRLMCFDAKEDTTPFVGFLQTLQHTPFPGVQLEWVLRSPSVATSGT
uniref:Ribosomal protein S10 n=1 Tax=prasinophyte sp. MBIC10622 TaxID=156113 RepID=A0A650AKI6_9CHLO|nr:ribosomal protein S10 [prasinophyte sp. MBIC10622]